MSKKRATDKSLMIAQLSEENKRLRETLEGASNVAKYDEKVIEKLEKEKQELLELLNETVEQLKSARYCIEEGDCALEAGPEWMFDIQEMIEEVLQKYEGDNDEN